MLPGASFVSLLSLLSGLLLGSVWGLGGETDRIRRRVGGGCPSTESYTPLNVFVCA